MKHLEKQQSRVDVITKELSELNLGINDTLTKLKREELKETKTRNPFARKSKKTFCIGDEVEVTNSYKGAQGNLKGKRGVVLAVGSSFITIDIPTVEGTTFRSPSNLKLITPSESIELQNADKKICATREDI